VSQVTLEKVLLAALREAGVEVRAPHQATAIEQRSDRVNVRVVRRDLVTLGSPAHYSEWEPAESAVVGARYVIGADGYDSRVRSALGLECVDIAAPETYAMFELPNKTGARHTGQLGFSDRLGTVMYPLPGGRVRWGFQINVGLDRPADAQRLNELLTERAPKFTNGTQHVEWGSVIHFERRVVRRFGKGRVWLAGDAAHVTSPLGNQSMNVGLQEAWDLGQRMAESVRGTKLGVLDQYGMERQREWHKLLGINVSFDLLRHAPPWLAARARDLVPAIPASGSDLEEILDGLGLRLS
jgi:2-polyprenyl-6-methoxyphenol hydroxylase-like FAD-dependent oxidoreductase